VPSGGYRAPKVLVTAQLYLLILLDFCGAAGKD
jgi:hypothetical protein